MAGLAMVPGDGVSNNEMLHTVEDQIRAGRRDKQLDTLKERDGISDRLLQVIEQREAMLTAPS